MKNMKEPKPTPELVEVLSDDDLRALIKFTIAGGTVCVAVTTNPPTPVTSPANSTSTS